MITVNNSETSLCKLNDEQLDKLFKKLGKDLRKLWYGWTNGYVVLSLKYPKKLMHIVHFATLGHISIEILRNLCHLRVTIGGFNLPRNKKVKMMIALGDKNTIKLLQLKLDEIYESK
jgi:hypothetical protein